MASMGRHVATPPNAANPQAICSARCYKILSCDQLAVTPKGHTPWETLYPLYKYMTLCNKDDGSVICLSQSRYH
jgi:hypothetical protein